MVMMTDIIERSGDRNIAVDVFAPQTRGNRVAIILVHGGGFVFGDRSDTYRYAERFAAKGFTAIAAQYGLRPSVIWPGQLEDLRAVIRWTKGAAEKLKFDADKIVVVGFSAGGQLALLAAGTSEGSGNEDVLGDGRGTSVCAVVSCFAPGTLVSDGTSKRPAFLDQMLEGEGEQMAKELSPVTYVNPSFPSTLILAGNKDVALPLHMTMRLFEALTDAGASPELHVLHGQNHEYSALPSMIDPFVEEVTFFLRRVVLEPEHFQEEDQRLNIFAAPDILEKLATGNFS